MRIAKLFMDQPMIAKQCAFVVGMGGYIMMAANPAWAVQAHGGIEGLVAHQIGHLLFVVGMGYLLFRLYKIEMVGPGWFEFKGFLWLILVWNFLTFSGHWLNEYVSPAKFAKVDGHTIAFYLRSLTDAFFYLTRLDHLFLVPALAFLLLALRKWRLQE
ncbi:MAG: hypothetical protein KKB30_07505 [Proteobacteria bacterium]|nr:hypothetical protein [Pseudomonadota bacterium]MBU1717114.1 hypothetical protein [Pseudomonadota bacterium]